MVLYGVWETPYETDGKSTLALPAVILTLLAAILALLAAMLALLAAILALLAAVLAALLAATLALLAAMLALLVRILVRFLARIPEVPHRDVRVLCWDILLASLMSSTNMD